MESSKVWDFSKLPQSEHRRTILAVRNNNVAELITIHDQYNLSRYSYCCGNDAAASVVAWFKWGIENDLINDE